MPSIFRPDPADIPGTYYDLPSIRANIDELHAHSDHSIVSAVWLDILREQLPVEDFYHIRPEEDTEAGEHRRWQPEGTGHSLLSRRRVPHTNATKGSGKKASSSLLVIYLGWLETGGGAARTPAYGAIAVGRYVRFLRWSYEERTVEHWVPGDWSPAYCIGRDWREIQHVLDEILALH
ncbi:hypothetical protein ASPWEDRAFT_187275 [Aspergillus wentii DTO 134E9]|uniref:Uncharacterized protein n=1 Tax=Aspergillus wentii DTO 134E9 TaxID=1073089 RepID=A0A1L9R8Z9_ASPWE|nr:uncharacterized protein ASPWEDRAFT_187275 [Aspergillus wentii DTO 134E9]KAI9926555.1 hypothetical protein MW887_004323 [Aspergillus wentii]OJJ31396.1 hypothetical protein ASPWEDRAFT_187275 [Aspergillus wentii DTO 134E9]